MFFVTRDSEYGMDYTLYLADKEDLSFQHGVWYSFREHYIPFSEEEWASISDIRLEPGDGPKPVKLWVSE